MAENTPKISLQEWAKRGGFTRTMCYWWIKSGRLPVSVEDGHYVIPADTPRPERRKGGRKVTMVEVGK
jgi:predicted site-specific integrase-resolvase